MPHSDKQVMSTRLDPSEALLVELEAEREGVTRSEWLRRTIRARLAREREDVAPPPALSGALR